ncbi:phenylacetate-CoA oxygenase subunit PaaI [Streptomonospora sp. S1-112]|uniref:Phenylacetate-CoA oxygenase subunit PaaI n=1 Tax=Streptomonospora mangrovi TaxID=2883123 RepID=A0A9X3SD21_9ACTN|nr:Phenylacetic acid catabolic protein [Streptomonospora mangrovi]MDA0564313.1 phenylacetate-CoA oxygenase subunit PaaI [Streptomonospora mangrovi]
MNESGAAAAAVDTAATAYVQRLGDDALIAGHRLADPALRGLWRPEPGAPPDDSGAAAIAGELAELGRSLLGCAGRMEEQLTGVLRTEDDLVAGRSADQFHNLRLVELPNTDLAHAVVRQLLFSAYAAELYAALVASTDPGLARIARTAAERLPRHRDHAVGWVARLGAADDARHRLSAALGAAWPATGELFALDEVARTAAEAGVGVDPGTLRPAWERTVAAALGEARLAPPGPVPPAGPTAVGGRGGVHGAGFEEVLSGLRGTPTG